MEEIKQPNVKAFFNYLVVYKYCEQNTINNYQMDANCFFEYTKNTVPLKIEVIKEYVEYLLRDKGYKRSTIARRISFLKSYYNFLYDEKLIHVEIGTKIKYIKADPKAILDIEPQKEIYKKLDSITKIRDRALLETIYATGIRETEVSNLDIEHVNFEYEIITIVKGKGKKPRVVPITKAALKWIKALIGIRVEGPVFLNNQAKRLGTHGVYNICKKYFPFSPHHLRHAFGTHMMEATGGNSRAIADMMGHADTKTLENIYTHHKISHLQEIFKQNKVSNNR